MTSPRLILAAAAALFLVPVSAHASTVELKADGTLAVRAAAGEGNNVHVKPEGIQGVRVRDFGATLRAAGSGCLPSGEEIVCRTGVTRVDVALGDKNDLYVGQHGFAAVVDGGAGDDMYLHDGKTGLTTTRTDFRGGAGTDSANYQAATTGVIVSKDNAANDGRTITGTTVIDRDNIRDDVERLIGSSHNDSLNGNAGASILNGGPGSDLLNGGSGNDRFETGGAPDGADIMRGGAGFDSADFRNRNNAVFVSVGHGTRDDGEAGEGDDVTAVESVNGGRGHDVISQVPGSAVGLQVFGGAGNDTLLGAAGADVLFGEAGADFYGAGPGADTIFAADGERDTVDCGTNPAGLFDAAQVDAQETSVRNCESSSVGKLALKASGDDVRVSWSHPKGWRHLRSVKLRVLDGDRQLGQIVVHPRVSARGEIDVARSKVDRSGKTVTARLRLRGAEDRKLVFEVEAVDVDGRRQVER
jgi:Ca2+-binding RTX toxin-like protein